MRSVLPTFAPGNSLAFGVLGVKGAALAALGEKAFFAASELPLLSAGPIGVKDGDSTLNRFFRLELGA